MSVLEACLSVVARWTFSGGRGRRFTLVGVLSVAIGTSGAAACGGREPDAAASAESARAREVAARAPAAAPAAPECPKTGKWDECNVRQRLERAGLAPVRLAGERRYPFMRVPAIVYRVGRDTLQVFIYGDARAVAADVAKLDTLRVQPSDTTVAWGATPTLMTSNNMAAILLSDRPTQIERVRLALTAGLPAAEKK